MNDEISGGEIVTDPIREHFAWFAGMRPVSDCFAAGTTEHTILTRLVEGWGRGDTATLLRELSAEFGEAAFAAVEQYLALNLAKDWGEIGQREANDGTEIDDFIRLLWDPLPKLGFEFTVDRGDDGSAAFRVTRCPIFELAERLGMHDWLYRLSCYTDEHSAPAFSDRIVFTRTKTLMEGHDHCNHHYRYR